MTLATLSTHKDEAKKHESQKKSSLKYQEEIEDAIDGSSLGEREKRPLTRDQDWSLCESKTGGKRLN